MSLPPKVAVVLLFAVAFAAACGTAPQTAADPTVDTAAINDLRSQFETAYNAGDAATVAALYGDDAVLLPDHHSAVSGHDGIQQYYQDLFTQYSPHLTIMPADTQITGALAHEHGTFTVTIMPKAGGKAMTDNGKYLVILKRQAEGVWKIHHDIDNSSNSLPGMPGK